MKIKAIMAFLLFGLLLISGCGQKADDSDYDNNYDNSKSSSLDEEAENFDQGSDDLSENEFDDDLGADVE